MGPHIYVFILHFLILLDIYFVARIYIVLFWLLIKKMQMLTNQNPLYEVEWSGLESIRLRILLFLSCLYVCHYFIRRSNYSVC